MVQEATVDLLKIRKYDRRTTMGADAARMIVDRINQLLRKQEYVNMIFGAAPSQDEVLSGLARDKNIEWKRVNAFHMDEYIGLDENAPQGFGNFLKARLFSRVPFHRVYYINGNAEEPQLECERYAKLLTRHPADIVCLGIGENAHIAFNDPHVAFFDDPHLVKVVALDQKCRQQQVNDKCFNTIEEVPARAITLTIPALFRAKYAYCIVPGKTKAEAVSHTLTQGIAERFPSSILRKHESAILYLDQDSSRLLEGIPLF